jgi:polar amino acid transport system substrate-binding protein
MKGRSMKSLLLVLMLLFLAAPAFAEDAPKESAYDRVLRTGVLKCAYALSGDAVKKDPTSGEISGFTVDIINAMVSDLSLKVEWSDEVGYGDFAEGLKTGRYDAFCGALTATPARARVAKFTRPYMGYLTFAYVRSDEARFSTYEDMNKPEIKAGVSDGEVYQVLTRKYFPKTTEVSSPNMTPPSQLLMDLIAGKVDVVVHTPAAVIPFDKANPGKVRRAFAIPLGVAVPGFAVGPHEGDLRDMLDVAIIHLQNIGKIDAILAKYGLDKTQSYRVSPLFDVPENDSVEKK